MDRYNKLADYEKTALDRLYIYLGFNEVASFEKYLEYIFQNAKESIKFIYIFNQAIKNIIVAFWSKYPEYKKGYISTLWIDPKDIMKYTECGSKYDLDPRGVIRDFVKHNFNMLVRIKR